MPTRAHSSWQMWGAEEDFASVSNDFLFGNSRRKIQRCCVGSPLKNSIVIRGAPLKESCKLMNDDMNFSGRGSSALVLGQLKHNPHQMLD